MSFDFLVLANVIEMNITLSLGGKKLIEWKGLCEDEPQTETRLILPVIQVV